MILSQPLLFRSYVEFFHTISFDYFSRDLEKYLEYRNVPSNKLLFKNIANSLNSIALTERIWSRKL